MAGILGRPFILAAIAVAFGVVVLLLLAWPVTETCEEHARRGGYGAMSRQCLIVEDRLFRWDVRLWHLPRLHQWLTAGVVAVGSWVALMLAARHIQRRSE
jgi:hypothetical protein